MKTKLYTYCIVLAVFIPLLIVLNILVGSVYIPFSDVMAILGGDTSNELQAGSYIIYGLRLPQVITAILCGASLATSGLLLQTTFKNPLAGPSLFGIDAGAALGVALVLLMMGGNIALGGLTASGYAAVLIAAFVGSITIALIVLFFSNIVRNAIVLLIIGIMIGYLTSSAITLLNFYATADGVRSYLLWGMGSFNSVTLEQIPLFSLLIISVLISTFFLIKPLNAFSLGELYARNLGIKVQTLRSILLIITGLLVASVTSFCGPISFIGLAVPHLVRLIISSEDNKWLLPLTLFTGVAMALFCNLLCVLPGERGALPLNAVTSLVGAPIVLYVIVFKLKRFS